MSRQYQIVGETMVMVRFGDHILKSQLSTSTPVNPTRIAGGLVYELGLTETAINITPNPFHLPLPVSDFGTKVPADIIFDNVECTVTTNLAHFDTAILDVATSEAWGGPGVTPGAVANLLNWGETLMGAGSLLGNNVRPGFSGCHFVGLILAPDGATRYEFPGAFLTAPPYTYPIGTKRSVVECKWRCIPYNPTSGITTTFSGSTNFSITVPNEIMSSGATLLSRLKQL